MSSLYASKKYCSNRWGRRNISVGVSSIAGLPVALSSSVYGSNSGIASYDLAMGDDFDSFLRRDQSRVRACPYSLPPGQLFHREL
jgi:hypothetical protein